MDHKFEITREIAVLSQSASGWTLELNEIRWRDKSPKLDLRRWGANHTVIGKGITFSHDEAVQLHRILALLLDNDASEKEDE